MPDYTKSSEINQERIKRDYKEIFGVYLDDISKDDNN